MKKESALTFDLAIDDVLQSSEELKEWGFQKQILFGHSEGALIAEAAALKTRVFEGVILAA